MLTLILTLVTLTQSSYQNEALSRAAVSSDTWRSVEDYELGATRDRVLFLYSAMLVKELRDEEWKGVGSFLEENPGCDLACVIRMARVEIARREDD